MRPQEECTPNFLFEQGTQSQEHNQELPIHELEARNNQPVSKESDGHQGQKNLPQRMRNQVEIDAQIALNPKQKSKLEEIQRVLI